MIELQHRTFANGLQVIIAPNHKAPVVNLTVSYRVGSKDESPAHTGLAHLFEHLMFDNIEGDNKSKFDLYLTEAGGESNAYTTYDYTLYHFSLPSTHIELGAWLESQRMAHFVVPQRALETQINVVSEEILQTIKNRPYGTWRELQSTCAYTDDCMYSWEVAGTREHVQKTTYADAQLWYNRFYRPDNAVLVLSGDINSVHGFELAEKYFAQIPPSNLESIRNHFSPSQCKSGQVTEVQKVPHDAVFLSYHCDGFLNEATLAADVLSSILADGQSSRLYRSMIYDQQIASEIECFADKREKSSLVTLVTIARSEDIQVDVLSDALQAEISKLISDGITEQEMTKARNKLQTSIAYELQTCAGVAEAVALQMLFWNDAERVNTLMERYASISRDDVMDFARSTFREANRVQVEIRTKN